MALTPENLSGLVVGEGCFYAESAPDAKYRSGWRIRPAFCIEMRHEERPVLEEVQRMLECGAIYHLDFGRYRGYQTRGWKPHVKYRVTRIGDLHGRVVPFFESYPLFGRKLEAFELFAELVKGLHAKEHLSDDGLRRLKKCAAQLAKHNERGGNSLPPEAQDAVARVRVRSARR